MKRHINVLYGAVVILLLLQVMTFLATSSQTAKIFAEQNNLKNEFDTQISDLRVENRNSINEIINNLDQQNNDFKDELKLLRDEQEQLSDFSGVIGDAVKKVVSVTTDKSAGTGFVVDSSGYIVTNNHVVEGSNFVKVLTYDDQLVSAEIIGVDEFTDIAVLKVKINLDSFDLADSDEINVGEKVIAIGNPLGLTSTVTEGIVSALNRQGPNGLKNYIQTDVPLNPGNSGGPLINKAGEVIGINNFKVGEAEALGFALESNVLKEKFEDIISA